MSKSSTQRQKDAHGHMVRPNQLLPLPDFKGPIFDGDTHIIEPDFSMFDKYLPKKYHKDWLISKKYGPDGVYGTYVGDRRAENSEANPEGLIAPPGKLKEWLKAMKEGKSNVDGWIKPTIDMYDPEERIKKLDAEMMKHARNLEFEAAARLRDQIAELRRAGLGLVGGRRAG